MLSPFELERRKLYVTATDIPAIIGVSPYRNAGDVYLEKTQPLTDWKGNDATEAGNLLEPAILNWARSQLGVVLDGEWLVHENGINACTLDGRLPNGEPVEAKSHGIVGPADWKAWGKEGTDEIPDVYALQVQAQMFVTGAERTWVPALIGGRGFLMYQVERHLIIQEMIENISLNFWNNHVLKRIPPDSSPHLETLKRMQRSEGKVTTIDDGLAVAYLAACKVESAAKADKEATQEALLDALGDGDGARWNGGEFTYCQQSRKGYSVEPCTYRVLRHKSPKDASRTEVSRPEFTIDDAATLADVRLQGMGYILKEQSSSGSRYYVALLLPDVRVSDHAANEATGLWMERNGVLEVRLDRYDVPGQLERISMAVNGHRMVLNAKGLSV